VETWEYWFLAGFAVLAVLIAAYAWVRMRDFARRPAPLPREFILRSLPTEGDLEAPVRSLPVKERLEKAGGLQSRRTNWEARQELEAEIYDMIGAVKESSHE
jgi:hypothetical protein